MCCRYDWYPRLPFKNMGTIKHLLWVACEIDKLMLPQAKQKDDDPNESFNICRIGEPWDEQIRPGVTNTKIYIYLWILDTNCSSMLLRWRLGDRESMFVVIPNRCGQTYAYLSIENAIGKKNPYPQYSLGLGESIGESCRYQKVLWMENKIRESQVPMSKICDKTPQK